MTAHASSQSYGDLLLANLTQAKAARAAARETSMSAAARTALRTYQSARLEASYTDLLASPRYHDAARFFLDDLYGPKEFAQRDEDIARIVPTLVKLLPAAAVATLAQAIELDALSETLDAALLAQLNGAVPSAATYAPAYAACANRPLRGRQLVITTELGASLNRLTKVPLLLTTLKMMSVPARAAGLGQLQRFLERGFSAFKKMGDASDFVATVVGRERAMMEQWFAASQKPHAPHAHPESLL